MNRLMTDLGVASLSRVAVANALPGIKVGDFVDVRYPDGVIQNGTIVNVDADTVMVRHRPAHREAGAIIVHVRRLRRATSHRWQLDL